VATPTPIITEGPYVEAAWAGSPVPSVILHGGTSVSGATSITTWLWSIVSSSLGAGSLASLLNADTDTVTVQGMVEGEALRILLVVTNDLSESSLSNAYPVQSGGVFVGPPATAFVVVANKLEHTGLVMYPPGGRDWDSRAFSPLVNVVEAMEPRLAAAEDATVAVATVLAPGTVKLSDAPVDPAAPVVSNIQRVVLSGSYTGNLAVVAGGSSVPDGQRSAAQVALMVVGNMYLDAYIGILGQRGTYAGGTNHVRVDVYLMTAAQYATDDFAGAASLSPLAWAKDTSTRVATIVPAPGYLLPSGAILAFVVTNAPTTLAPADLTVSVHCHAKL